MFEVNHPCDSFNLKMNVWAYSTTGSLSSLSLLHTEDMWGVNVGLLDICSTLCLEAMALPETPQTHISCTKYLYAPYVQHTHTLMPNFNYSCLYFSTVSH